MNDSGFALQTTNIRGYQCVGIEKVSPPCPPTISNYFGKIFGPDYSDKIMSEKTNTMFVQNL